jgi:hypothetical protein
VKKSRQTVCLVIAMPAKRETKVSTPTISATADQGEYQVQRCAW